MHDHIWFLSRFQELSSLPPSGHGAWQTCPSPARVMSPGKVAECFFLGAPKGSLSPSLPTPARFPWAAGLPDTATQGPQS